MSTPADAFTEMLHAIDLRDWAGVRRAFADRVAIDYSSLFGVPAATVDADSQVAGWQKFAGGFDVTQHVTGPIVVSEQQGDTARLRTHIRAFHRIAGAPGGDVWMVAGHYDVRMRRIADAWKIAGITLTVFYQDGNLALPKIVQDRIA
jgi:SnoaL-like domain